MFSRELGRAVGSAGAFALAAMVIAGHIGMPADRIFYLDIWIFLGVTLALYRPAAK